MASSRPQTPSSQPRRRNSQRSSGVYLLTQPPKIHYPIDGETTPLESTSNSERFGRVSDAMEELDVNMSNLQHIHDAVALGFNESFASFMYGLSITMWCVDFPGCPTSKAWEELQESKAANGRIERLRTRLQQKRDENSELKRRLDALKRPRTSQVSSSLTASTASTAARARPSVRAATSQTFSASANRLQAPPAVTHAGRSNKTSTSNDEDSYVTNEGSFVVHPNHSEPQSQPQPKRTRLSRIPQPPRSNIARSSSPETSKRGPNLNQPPRYMRGLFDSSNTARPTVRRKPIERAGTEQSRPRFR